jgi:hypothetical protein
MFGEIGRFSAAGAFVEATEAARKARTGDRARASGAKAPEPPQPAGPTIWLRLTRLVRSRLADYASALR